MEEQQLPMRNVKGFDYIVTYSDRDDTVSVRKIYEARSINGHFTPDALLATLGFTRDTATLQFMKNNNLHYSGKALQGAVLLINLNIGMIVKSVGTYMLFHVLFPRRRSGFMIIDLTVKDRHYGFFLQQIRGPRMAEMSVRRHGQDNENYPYLIDGDVYMDPAGPDFCRAVSMDTVREANRAVADEFLSLKENLCTRSIERTPSHIFNMRKSKKVNVIYIVDDNKRVDMGEAGDMFYLPVGGPTEDEVKCPWKGLDGKTGGTLYHTLMFLPCTKDRVTTILQWGTLSSRDFYQRIWDLGGRRRSNFLNVIVPSIDWSLNVILVTQECYDGIYNSLTYRERVEAKIRGQKMLFVQEEKSVAQSRGVAISNWVLGDPQVSRTRITYEYVKQYKSTYGSGYGSRPRSSCLDSVNSYRDRRFNARVHPSPLIHDRDIGNHQYFSSSKQRSCLLQMKLESILHSLTSDITLVAERMNPFMVGVTSGLSTKLIATTGQKMYSFCNGLHTDTCDRINGQLKSKLFPNVEDEVNQRTLSFEHISFPTTCGYQHVWKNQAESTNHQVHHYFLMPGLRLGISLQDSICHHFMGGAFAHCTSICVLQTVNEEDADMEMYSISNVNDKFAVFAWGSASNSRTATGNMGRENSLANHRTRQAENRANAEARNAAVRAAVRAAPAQVQAAPAVRDAPAQVQAAEVPPAQVRAGPVQVQVAPAVRAASALVQVAEVPLAPVPAAQVAPAVRAASALVQVAEVPLAPVPAATAQVQTARTVCDAPAAEVPPALVPAIPALVQAAPAVHADSAQVRAAEVPLAPVPIEAVAAEVQAAEVRPLPVPIQDNGTAAFVEAAEKAFGVPPQGVVPLEAAATDPEPTVDRDGYDCDDKSDTRIVYEDDSFLPDAPLDKKPRARH